VIITAIITFVVGILSWIIAFIPSMKIDLQPENQSSFIGVINSVSCLVPINTVGFIITAIVVTYAVEFLWYVFNWVIAKIPFID
jgi:hypothetical protein